MLKNICCSICLSINKRTINIYDTDLQYVYENLANLKISDDECWMCYICHTRLQQCHQLQQLAIQTRGLVDDILQNKIDIKFGAFGSLVQLSTSETTITEGTSHSSCIKQESDIQMEFCNNGSKQDGILENHYEVEVEGLPLSMESEDPLVDTTQPSSNVAFEDLQRSKVLEVKIVKRSRSADGEYFLPATGVLEDRRQAWRDQSTDSAVVKLEIEEIREKSIDHYDEQDNTDDCEGRDHAGEARAGRYKKPHSCGVCFKTFKFKSDFLRHNNIHSTTKPFSCDICSRRFKSRECLNRHMRVHISHLPYSCQICLKKFLFESDLQRHARSHRGDEPRSALSSKDQTCKDSLNNHTGTHGDDQTNFCNICSKRFSNKGSFTRHMRIHTGEKPYVCHICAKKFIEKSALDIHLIIHTGVKPFSCHVCSKKFSLKVNLKRHSLIHTGKKPFRCDICFKEFRYKRTFMSHKRRQCGARKDETKTLFSCSICTEKFSNERYLNAHTRIHTSDKIFNCDLCPKKFVQKKYLNRHIQSHTGDRPYSCDICSQKFTQKGSLKVHKRSHAGDRKFSCHICSKKFLRNSTLQAHIKIHQTRSTTHVSQ